MRLSSVFPVLLCVLLFFSGCGGSNTFQTAGTTNINLSATRLGFVTQPSRAGELFSSFQVGIFDEAGELVPLDGILITLSSPDVTLLGETTQTTLGGMAVFNNVSTNSAAEVTLTASAPNLQSAQSSRFVVGPTDPDSVSLNFQPADILIGETFNFSLSVTDSFGNPIPGLTVNLTVREAGLNTAVLTSGTTTAITDANGVASFNSFSALQERTAYLQVEAAGVQAQSDPFNILAPRVVGRDWRLSESRILAKGLAVGDGKLVGVGENGTYFLSLDRRDFESGSTGFLGELEGVTHGMGVFVAVGQGGGILTSADGTLWVQRNSPVTRDLHDVVFANGVFVAVGDGAQSSVQVMEPYGLNGFREQQKILSA